MASNAQSTSFRQIFAASGENGPLGNADFARHLNQLFDYLGVLNPFCNFLQQSVMPYPIGEAGQIHVNYGRHPSQDTATDAGQCLIGRAFWSKSVRVRTEIGLKDGFQYQFQRALCHPIRNTENLKGFHLPVGLRNVLCDWVVAGRFRPGALRECFPGTL